MSSCFISDLHLDHKREDIKKAFFKFLESEASEFENLYILGDLFEVGSATILRIDLQAK